MDKYVSVFLRFLIITSVSISTALAAGSHTNAEPAKPIAQQRALTPDEQSIQNLLNLWAKAMETRSVDSASKVVLPDDFSVIESGYANWTWQDYRDNHLGIELDAFKDISYTIELLSGEFQGNLGFAIYRFTATGIIVASNKTMTTSGLATAVLEKHPDLGWRMHHLHTSVPRPMGGH